MAAEQFLTHLTDALNASRAARAEVRAADSPGARLALGMWRRADDLAEGVAALTAKRLAEPIGVLARTLWEGAVTAEYVRGHPEVRQRQLLVTALIARRALRNEAWVQEIRAEIDDDLSAREQELISEATRAEAEYKAERQTAKEAGQDVGRFDYDRAAELPSVETRAKAIGADGQYLVYRFESAGVHWQAGSLLHLFSAGGEHLSADETPAWRLEQVVVLAASSYAILVSQCMALLDLEPPPELDVGVLTQEN
jgi:hypothetical protein